MWSTGISTRANPAAENSQYCLQYSAYFVREASHDLIRLLDEPGLKGFFVIVGAANIDTLIQEGKLLAGSRVDFAKSGVGIAAWALPNR